MESGVFSGNSWGACCEYRLTQKRPTEMWENAEQMEDRWTIDTNGQPDRN